MLENIDDTFKETSYTGLARTFHRLGWCGFWTQVVVGAIPMTLMAYLFLFAGSTQGPRAGFRFVEFLTLISLAILLFTTVWSFRYTRLAKRIASPDSRPTNAFLDRTAWTGIIASTTGVMISIVVMLLEVAHLLFYFLSMPQAGVPVVQTTNGKQVSWVSSVDMLSLMALTLTLFAEIVILVFSLWLLSRVTLVASKSPDQAPV